MSFQTNKGKRTRGKQLLHWQADYAKVQTLLRGNESAWEDLYQETYPLAANMARKSNASFCILVDADIQDIVSEAFQRCLSRLRSFQGRSRFSTWVCGFVRYVTLETIRKKISRQKRLQKYFICMYPPSQYADPESCLLEKERNTCLWIAFYSLSAKHQAILACFVLKWNSISEARTITGLCYADMKSELTEALEIFRNRFFATYYT